MKKMLFIAVLAMIASNADAQVGRRNAPRKSTTRAQTDTTRYVAPDSSATDRGAGFDATPGLSPRTEKSDPARQADQKSNATDPQNQNYERRQP